MDVVVNVDFDGDGDVNMADFALTVQPGVAATLTKICLDVVDGAAKFTSPSPSKSTTTPAFTTTPTSSGIKTARPER